jgi:hypothetical protein
MSAISLAMAACAIRDRDRYEVAGSMCREARAPTKARPTQVANSRLEMVSPGAEPVAAPEKARVRTGQTLPPAAPWNFEFYVGMRFETRRGRAAQASLILLQLGT